MSAFSQINENELIYIVNRYCFIKQMNPLIIQTFQTLR